MKINVIKMLVLFTAIILSSSAGVGATPIHIDGMNIREVTENATKIFFQSMEGTLI